LLRLLY